MTQRLNPAEQLLQWGRVLMNAETGQLQLVGGPDDGVAELQWGRVLMNAETVRGSTSEAGCRSLRFNGAAFS